MLDALEPVLIDLPAIVKAVHDEGGRRLVAVEASNESVDSEGDVITQKALLDAAPAFVKAGTLDIDHLSEIGDRYGLNPADWIVGVPVEVRDLGGRRTEVVGELHKAQPGRVTKADELWDGLTRNPPVPWRASIFGWPARKGGLIDARREPSPEYPMAKRYIVKGFSTWKSLAFTRTPVNDAIVGTAQVVTMKAFFEGLADRGMVGKADSWASTIQPATMAGGFLLPRNRMELVAHYEGHIDREECPYCSRQSPLGRSVAGFREHFVMCCGCDQGTADVFALALMQALKHRG